MFHSVSNITSVSLKFKEFSVAHTLLFSISYSILHHGFASLQTLCTDYCILYPPSFFIKAMTTRTIWECYKVVTHLFSD